jgi:hypothetical protein
MSDRDGVTSIEVFTSETVRLTYQTTLLIPSGLSDEEIDDLLEEGRYQRLIYTDENRESEVSYGDQEEFSWIRSGQTWNPLSREEHLLVHTRKKKPEIGES